MCIRDSNINDFINILNDNFIAPPSWIVETNNGFQLGFILKKPFNLNDKYLSESDKKAIKYAKYLQQKMLMLFDGDPAANRLKGWWKNPIGMSEKYKLYFNNKHFFNLSDFDIILQGIEEYELKNNNKGNTGGDFHNKEKQKIIMLATKLFKGDLNILNQINEGIRNSFIWYIGMDLSKKIKEWESFLYFYNNKLNKPLKEIEMENIIKSIKKYNREGKNKVCIGGYNNWTKELKREYIKTYRIKKGLVKGTRKQQKQTYKNKIIQAIYKIIEKNEKLTNKNIADTAKVSIKTVIRHKKELLKINHFAQLFKK
jgi:hypothetical protein